MRRALEEKIGVSPKTYWEAIAISQLVKAALGDTQAARFISENAEGLLKQQIENVRPEPILMKVIDNREIANE